MNAWRGRLIILLLLVTSGMLVQANSLLRIAEGDEVQQTFPLSDVAAGTEIHVQVIRQSGDLIPVVGLIPAGGGRALISAEGDETGIVELQYIFEEAGDYEVVITREGGNRGITIGDFLLSVQRSDMVEVQFDTEERPLVVLTLPGRFEGSLSAADRGDGVYIELASRDTLSISYERLDENLEAKIVIYNPLGRTSREYILRVDQATLTYDAALPGYYHIVVEQMDETNEGRYALSLELVPED